MKNNFLKSAVKLFLIVVLITSCSSSDDNNPIKDHYKISVTLNNLSATNDFASIVAVGSSNNGNNTYPMWKVNSKEKAATQTIYLGKNDFTGSTTAYIIETVNPIDIYNGCAYTDAELSDYLNKVKGYGGWNNRVSCQLGKTICKNFTL